MVGAIGGLWTFVLAQDEDIEEIKVEQAKIGAQLEYLNANLSQINKSLKTQADNEELLKRMMEMLIELDKKKEQ